MKRKYLGGDNLIIFFLSEPPHSGPYFEGFLPPVDISPQSLAYASKRKEGTYIENREGPSSDGLISLSHHFDVFAS